MQEVAEADRLSLRDCGARLSSAPASAYAIRFERAISTRGRPGAAAGIVMTFVHAGRAAPGLPRRLLPAAEREALEEQASGDPDLRRRLIGFGGSRLRHRRRQTCRPR